MSRPYVYASAADVLGHLQFIATVTATSKPNAAQVDLHIREAADELDGALRQVAYTTPVATGATQSLGLLSAWNGIGAAAYTAAALPAGGDGKHQEYLERRWDAILSGIRTGDTELPDLDRDSTRSAPRYAGWATAAFGRDFQV